MLFLLALAATGATIPGQFIVELDLLPAAGMRNGAARTHRARLRAEHDTMRTRLRARRAQVFGETHTVLNSVFVQLNGDDALEQLRATQGVKRVYPVREFRRVLDRIVLTHKAVDVWAQVGESRAGDGVKVGIIDSGIDIGHPALKGEGFTALEGFPKAANESDLAYTNGKVIVARSYVSLLSRSDPDTSARDRSGHGTALAAIVAGARTAGPLATITGMAPRARIGAYKVFGSPKVNDSTSEAAVLQAIDDAVMDGMDVINLSLGSVLAPRLGDDPLVAAVERASRTGVLVIAAAGNNGPGLNTINSPGTASSAITVGAVTNSRTFSTSVEAAGLGTFAAVNSSGATATAPITGTVADVASLDRNGLGCEALPPSSLSGRVALILRGTCTFVVKLTNAQNAGAVAAIVYATAEEPDPFTMDTAAVSFPAQMVSNASGVAIKEAGAGGIVATLHFSPGPVERASGRRTAFSSAGPNVDASIKPEIVATGGQVYTATQTIDPAGDLYSPSGFIMLGGTSFSAPVVAGAAALLKAARPGLTWEQYRSLLINTATAAYGRQGERAGAQQIGAGTLNALAAVNAPAAVFPATLGFGLGGSEFDHRRNLALTNVGTIADTFMIEAESLAAAVPVADTVRVEPGATVQVPVRWMARGVTPGAYEGFLNVRSVASGQAIRVPYWYAATDNKPAAITILAAPASARPGATLRGALQFRVLDAAGVAIASGVDPEVLAEVGEGSARTPVSLDEVYPGVFQSTLSMGPVAGVHRFRVKAGEASALVSITVQ